MAEMMGLAKNREVFPFGVSTSTGSSSWTWREDVLSKQKPTDFKEFDPQREFFACGAHVPLMIFVGTQSESRRSIERWIGRNAAADKRGWTFQRRQTTAKTKGGGKGRGKGQSSGQR